MARDYARKCFDFPNKCGLVVALFLTVFQGAAGQRVQVDPEVESYPGQTVNLRCQFVNGGDIRLTQVSWIWEPKEGQRENIAVFHPTFGASYPDSPQKGRVQFTHSSLENPSISISELRMTDEGKYICEYATYPSGNEQGTTSLIMLAKPRNSASPVTVSAGTSQVVVARCESADGQPAAQIDWETAAKGNFTTTAKPGVDNTLTVVSEYRMVPTAEDNGADIKCIITHRTEDKAQIIPMKLSIEFPPTANIVGYDSNWYIGRTDAVLTCMTTGNPPPTNVTWRVVSGEMPDTVQIRENTLTVQKVDDAVNTTFVCEAKNRLGSSQAQITAFVTEKPNPDPTVGIIIGAIVGVLLLLVIIFVAIAVVRKRSQNAESADGPPNYKPPPPVKATGSTEMLNKSQDPLTESQPLSHTMYYETSGEPVTDLDANDEENGYTVGASSGWDDSAQHPEDEGQSETLPPYSDSPDRETPRDLPQDPNALSSSSSRGGSFVSPAMYV
ncbi:nectin-2-like isoform X2 [Megalops cyprinoides]|uniref:nectin-2-like isoform X2 n=1 Tax=Megalops cyprinoides TaxID=118141 RepID=UPI0018650265|nr:nectin-2-like isoform X2 [Megalops cyprinoides]